MNMAMNISYAAYFYRQGRPDSQGRGAEHGVSGAPILLEDIAERSSRSQTS